MAGAAAAAGRREEGSGRAGGKSPSAPSLPARLLPAAPPPCRRGARMAVRRSLGEHSRPPPLRRSEPRPLPSAPGLEGGGERSASAPAPARRPHPAGRAAAEEGGGGGG